MSLASGENWTLSVKENIVSGLHPGKYRIVSYYLDYGELGIVRKALDYCEFEIIEPGSNMPEKPTGYDWQFLNRFYYSEESDWLDIIKIENQPITTVDEYLNFNIDMETNDTAYWRRLDFEAKIDGQWRSLAIYDTDYYLGGKKPQKYYASYIFSSFFEPVELTLEKVSIPNVWAPAGPFEGEHRIRGELVLHEWTTAFGDGGSITQFDIKRVSGEFVIVDAADAGINTASAWAQDIIPSAIAAGLVPQNLQVKYQQPLTRAEFAALVVTFLEATTGQPIDTLLRQKNIAPEEGVFSDTNDADVLAAHALGTVSGKGDGIFGPDGNVTREQMATMIMRTQAMMDDNIPASTPANYADQDQFAAWAVPGINFITGQGIMSGVGDNRFDSKGNCTREQAIATFFRIINR